MGWLTAVEDGLRDVGGEIAEADQPREIRPAHALLLGQCRKGSAGAADEGGVETMRPDQQLDQARVGFGYGTRIVAVDQHPDLPPGAAKPYRHGQDLGFVIRRARQQCRGSVEERAKPSWADMDVDWVASEAEKCQLGFASRTRSEQSEEQSAEQLQQVDHPEAR